MHGPQVPGITKELLQGLYLEDANATLKTVGKQLGVHPETLRRWLLQFGIPTKSRVRVCRPRKPETKQLADKDWLADQLSTKSINQIAQELGTREFNVQYWAHKFGMIDDDKSVAVKDGLKKRFPHSRTGKDHPRWKGGRRILDGYIYLYAPDHPAAHHQVVQEHRLVMEKHLGRFLTSDELVHHKDGNKQNNAIENLELTYRSAHTHHHFQEVTELHRRIAELEAEVAQLRSGGGGPGRN